MLPDARNPQSLPVTAIKVNNLNVNNNKYLQSEGITISVPPETCAIDSPVYLLLLCQPLALSGKPCAHVQPSLSQHDQ
jgi:hypothetical protein